VVDLRGVGEAEDAAEAGRGVRVGGLPVRHQLQLLQLLGQRHLVQQALDLALDPLIAGRWPGRLQRRLVGRSRGRAHRPHHE